MENQTDKALRFNEGKLKWNLVDFKSIEPLVKVLEFGSTKYEVGNWKKDMDLDDILNSMLRHVIELADGYYTDKESGEPIVGHIMTNCMFFEYHIKKKLNKTKDGNTK